MKLKSVCAFLAFGTLSSCSGIAQIHVCNVANTLAFEIELPHGFLSDRKANPQSVMVDGPYGLMWEADNRSVQDQTTNLIRYGVKRPGWSNSSAGSLVVNEHYRVSINAGGGFSGETWFEYRPNMPSCNGS